MTLKQFRAHRPDVDRAKIAATTDADIRRHQIEDGEDPDAPLPPFRPVPDVRSIRERLRMTPETFAAALGVPVAMVRGWEHSGAGMDPAVRSLLRILEREPDAALRALADSKAKKDCPNQSVSESGSVPHASALSLPHLPHHRPGHPRQYRRLRPKHMVRRAGGGENRV